MTPTEVDLQAAMERATLEVEIVVVSTWHYRLRLWLSIRLIRLGAWIGSIHINEYKRIGIVITVDDKATPAINNVLKTVSTWNPYKHYRNILER